MSRKATLTNDHKRFLLHAVLKKHVKGKLVWWLYSEFFVESRDTTSVLKAKAPYCRCPEQISQTTNQNRSKMEHEIKKKRLVHEQAIAEISEATEQDTVCTVCNPPYWSICWTLYKRNVPVEILPCWNVKHELSFRDGIVDRNDRILVSATLHAKDPETEIARMGKDATLRRTRTSLSWPGMNKYLKQFIDM